MDNNSKLHIFVSNIWHNKYFYLLRMLLVLWGGYAFAQGVISWLLPKIAVYVPSFTNSHQAYILASALFYVGLILLTFMLFLRTLGHPDRSFRMTRALYARICITGALLTYAYFKPFLWPVAWTYCLYVFILVCHFSTNAYHRAPGRHFRNFIDFSIPVVGIMLDPMLISPLVLMLIVPLTVVGKFLWVRNSLFFVSLPLMCFTGISIYKVMNFYGLLDATQLQQCALYATTFHPFWLQFVCFGFIIYLICIIRFERILTSHRILDKMKDFAIGFHSSAGDSATSALICKTFGAKSCEILRQNADVWVDSIGGNRSVKEIDKLTDNSSFGAESICSQSADQSVCVILKGKNPKLVADLFFSDEEITMLDIVVNIIAKV